MPTESACRGWFLGHYSDLFVEVDKRAGESIDLPVLSVTKSRGPMLASERFGKAMHGRDLSRYRLAPRNHVVADPMLLWDGSIGLQTVAELGLVSPDYRVYAPTANTDPWFAGFLVRSPSMLPFYQGGARGTNVRRNRIARSDFLAIPIAVPPLPEQRKIAAILSSVDEAIEGTQAVIDQLQVVKKAMMADLLTRGLPVRHKTFKQTEIGEIPAEWEVMRMEGLSTTRGMVGGPFGSDLTAKDYVKEAGVPVVRGGNVTMGGFHEDEFVYVSLEKADVLSKNGARRGDIVMTQRGASLGETALIPADSLHSFYIISQTMMRMTPDLAMVVPRFLLHYICSPAAQAWLRAHQIATGQPHLNLGIFRDMPAVLPPPAEQERIAAALDQLDDLETCNQLELKQLRSLKSALMSLLLTGEVRVKVEGEAAA